MSLFARAGITKATSLGGPLKPLPLDAPHVVMECAGDEATAPGGPLKSAASTTGKRKLPQLPDTVVAQYKSFWGNHRAKTPGPVAAGSLDPNGLEVKALACTQAHVTESALPAHLQAPSDGENPVGVVVAPSASLEVPLSVSAADAKDLEVQAPAYTQAQVAESAVPAHLQAPSDAGNIVGVDLAPSASLEAPLSVSAADAKALEVQAPCVHSGSSRRVCRAS